MCIEFPDFVAEGCSVSLTFQPWNKSDVYRKVRSLSNLLQFRKHIQYETVSLFRQRASAEKVKTFQQAFLKIIIRS
jgi:hypothetical protein